MRLKVNARFSATRSFRAGISQPVYATVYMPKFKPSRNRFPAACIQLCIDADEERLAAEQDKRFAAVVLWARLNLQKGN